MQNTKVFQLKVLKSVCIYIYIFKLLSLKHGGGGVTEAQLRLLYTEVSLRSEENLVTFSLIDIFMWKHYKCNVQVLNLFRALM